MNEGSTPGAGGGSDAMDTAGAHEFGLAVAALGPKLLAGLEALEQAFRRLHPPDFPRLQRALAPFRDELHAASEAFGERPTATEDGAGEAAGGTAPDVARLHAALRQASEQVLRALSALVEPGQAGAMAALGAMHDHARAQATLYPLRGVLPPVSAWFAEPFRHADLERLEARPDATHGAEGRSGPPVGLFRAGEVDARGGFDLYVPEHYDESADWPLVVALHGGSGNGADFLWSWLREARSRSCLLLAPTSRGSTWSLAAPEIDGRALREACERVAARWRVDAERMLLTGLSDGATMTLLVGLAQDAPWTHLAPISGVLHPHNFALDNLERARDVPIWLVHGALDWMFPVALAREAARVLEDSGAALVYRELADLSHTYPREQNAAILEWLDPRRSVEALTRDA